MFGRQRLSRLARVARKLADTVQKAERRRIERGTKTVQPGVGIRARGYRTHYSASENLSDIGGKIPQSPPKVYVASQSDCRIV